jgi:DNA-binding XRE family transcriptional regulator
MENVDLKTLKVLPKRLIEARGEMRQAEAARQLGITRQHLERIESGGQRCPAHILLRMIVLYRIRDPLSVAGGQKFFATA